LMATPAAPVVVAAKVTGKNPVEKVAEQSVEKAKVAKAEKAEQAEQTRKAEQARLEAAERERHQREGLTGRAVVAEPLTGLHQRGLGPGADPVALLPDQFEPTGLHARGGQR
jgi:hypothetical protein